MTAPEPRPITAITFDLGNVLVRVDHLRFCRRLAALAHLTPQEVYAQVFESALEPGYDTGHIRSREFYQRVTAHFGVALPYSRFCDLWCDLFDPMEGMARTGTPSGLQLPPVSAVQHQCPALRLYQGALRSHPAAFPGLRPVL